MAYYPTLASVLSPSARARGNQAGGAPVVTSDGLAKASQIVAHSMILQVGCFRGFGGKGGMMSFGNNPQQNYGQAPKGVTPDKPFCKRRTNFQTNSIPDQTLVALASMSKMMFSLAFPLQNTDMATGKLNVVSADNPEGTFPYTARFDDSANPCVLNIYGVVDQFAMGAWEDKGRYDFL